LRDTDVYEQVPNVPLFQIKLALHRGGRHGCMKTESNCFTLGESMTGKPFSVTETIYVMDHAAENVRNVMIPTRYMRIFHKKNKFGYKGLKSKSENDLRTDLHGVISNDGPPMEDGTNGVKSAEL